MTSTDKMGGRSVHFKQNVINEITKLSSLYSLCEVWRRKNGDKQGFSWRDKTMKVQCRLDYFLISKRLLNTSKQFLSLFAPNTDHSAVVTHFQSEELSRKTGPGIWKFNSALLKDNEYVNGIRECVQLAKVKYKDVEDHRLSWDLIKMELRGYTMIIAFAKNKASKQRSREKDLQKQINEMLANAQNSRNNHCFLLELHKLKAELNRIMEHNIKGTILRSKVRWYEKGEKNSRYFLNLENRAPCKKKVSKLLLEGGNETNEPD